jgi:hypothetical protein
MLVKGSSGSPRTCAIDCTNSRQLCWTQACQSSSFPALVHDFALALVQGRKVARARASTDKCTPQRALSDVQPIVLEHRLTKRPLPLSPAQALTHTRAVASVSGSRWSSSLNSSGSSRDLSMLAPRWSQIDLQPVLEYLLTTIARGPTLSKVAILIISSIIGTARQERAPDVAASSPLGLIHAKPDSLGVSPCQRIQD